MNQPETPKVQESEESQKKQETTRILGAFALAFSALMVTGLLSLINPGYFQPLFTVIIGQIMLGICGVLSLIAFLITFRSSSIVVWILSTVFLVLPQVVVPFLGPAIITIISALGPIVK